MAGNEAGRGHKVGVLDMLSPFYNWVIELDTVLNWMDRAGFKQAVHLNYDDPTPCAFHVLGMHKN